MKLTNIIKLYTEMKNSKEYRRQFLFEYNKILADVFFFIDQEPFILAFGIKLTRKYFELEVKNGFIVDEHFDEELYYLICREFHITFDFSSGKFYPSYFLEALNQKIPQSLTKTNNVKPQNIACYHRNIEESDKIYFCGFLDNNKQGNKVRSCNLEKTKILMGEQAYQRCELENLSTKWTDERGKDRFKQWKQLKPDN